MFSLQLMLVDAKHDGRVEVVTAGMRKQDFFRTGCRMATSIAKSTLIALYYERTKRPDIETLLKIANYLGVSIDELLTPED